MQDMHCYMLDLVSYYVGTYIVTYLYLHNYA